MALFSKTGHCNRCGVLLPAVLRFCKKCGLKNDRFDKDDFFSEMDISIEEAIKLECELNQHNLHKGFIYRDIHDGYHERVHDFSYCSMCGKNIYAEYIQEQ